MDEDAVGRLVKWALVSASIFFLAVLLSVVAKSLVSWKAILLLFVVLVPAFFLSYRLSKAQRAYDRGRYGIGRRVVTERTTLTDDGCSACNRDETRNQSGIRRQFVKELVVDGVPVALVECGRNDYCADCAETTAEMQSQTDSEERERAG